MDELIEWYSLWTELACIIMEKMDGFAGQRMQVVPRPVVQRELENPLTKRLLVTDAGYFPAALHHSRVRTAGCSELVVIVPERGSGWLTTPHQRLALGPGQAVVIPPGLPHAYGADSSDPWSIWWVHLAGTEIAPYCAELAVTPEQVALPTRNWEPLCLAISQAITSLSRGVDRPHILAAGAAGWQLLGALVAASSLPEPGSPIERAIEYLAARTDRTIALADVAAAVQVSPSHLSALFQRATGGGVLAYHTSLKMAVARNLLDTTDISIRQVASAVGYGDQLYFSRQFRQHHGQSPRAYRNREQQRPHP